MPTSTRHRRTLLSATRSMSACLVALALLSTGCSSDPTSGSPSELGAYTLMQVNTQNLPFALTTTEGNVVVEAATLTLASTNSGNPTYAATVNGRKNGEFMMLLTDGGSYTRTGSTLTFSSLLVPGLSYPGNVSGNVVTVTIPGLAFGAAGTFNLRFQK